MYSLYTRKHGVVSDICAILCKLSINRYSSRLIFTFLRGFHKDFNSLIGAVFIPFDTKLYVLDLCKAVLSLHCHYGYSSFCLEQVIGGRVLDEGSL